MTNHLAQERSPYLLQHADNPVDWYPWGDEAFSRAAAEDKPIFLSIGYSTCHWCHVMAHESFEDAGIARLLNRDFVSIKLDREERPDIDRVYMTFVQATTGAGGWPMSVWLTPDRKPFLGGTYFPPSSRWGRPGFAEILGEVARAWKEDRARLVESADAVVQQLRRTTGVDEPEPGAGRVANADAVDRGVAAFAQAFDARHKGFGGAPKFPRPSELLFLLEASSATDGRRAKQMALDTLHAMAMGGIHDHIGGGFHRYSVDAEWRVPHFEKMLYDQAQLVLAYLEAYQASGDAFHASVAEDTLDYVLRDLTAPNGAFYSAEDADSRLADTGADETGHDSREGAFYVWRAAEIDAVAGGDASIVRRRFGIEDDGNALSDPQGEFGGLNVLYVAQSIEDVATRTFRSADDVLAALVRTRRAMFDARARRPRPHRDDKVVTAWNGLMMAAFARAASVLVDSPRRNDWRRAAERAAEAARDRLWRPEVKRLWRRDRGEAGVDAFCEDYACLAWGLLELFQASADSTWLAWAQELVDAQIALFWDERDGGWFSTTGDDTTVLLRLKEDYDGAEPSPASITVRNFLTLAHFTGDAALRDRAGRTLGRYGADIGRVARVVPMMLANVALWHRAPAQIVIVGTPGDAGRLALERASALAFQPAAVRLTIDEDSDAQAALARALPWTGALHPVGGRAAAYVCRDFACQMPVTDAAALATALEPVPPSRIILL